MRVDMKKINLNIKYPVIFNQVISFFLVLMAVWAITPVNVQADPKVYSPIVTKGKLAVGNRGNTTIDDDDEHDGSQRHVFLIEYGVTDWWKTEIVARLNKKAEHSLRYYATAWENIFQLTEQGKYWLDAGLYLEYKLKDEKNDPDIFEAKLLLEKPVQGFQNTLNLIIEQELGSDGDDDLEFGYAWRTRKEIGHHMKIGFEAFGELGELRDIESLDHQEHRIGPVFYHAIELGHHREIEYNIGWLFGLTDESPDNTFRWQIEFVF
jgi:hypothetical protein